jgi:hypothetical protein
MRMMFGLIYVALVMGVAIGVAVDLTAMRLRPVTQHEFGVLLLAVAMAMLGFMVITGKGFSRAARRSRYR